MCSSDLGVRVYTLSHITDGPFTPERFEDEMKDNLLTIAKALDETVQ